MSPTREPVADTPHPEAAAITAQAGDTGAMTGAGNAVFTRYAESAGQAPSAPARRFVRPGPTVHRADAAVGRALARAAALRAAPEPAAVGQLIATPGGEAEFNVGSIVHDLRRAIDQSEISDGWVEAEVGYRPTTRKVDAALVMRVLDGRTPDQIKQIETLYEAQEPSKLRDDLLGLGQSKAPSNLKPDQRARVEALLRGTAATAVGEPEARLEAIAIELHELLAKELDETGRERVMALHRRAPAELRAVEHLYAARYGQPLPEELARRLKGLQLERVTRLRDGDSAAADAFAIEDKRRALVELEAKAKRGELSFDEATHYDERRKRLTESIVAIADQNRQEALADAGRPAAEAMNERLAKIMATPVGGAGHTLAAELAFSFGGTATGRALTLTKGTGADVAAARLADMEARRTTSAERVAALLRGLREQAEHDVTLSVPSLSEEEKEQLRQRGKERKKELVAAAAAAAIKDFLSAYEQRRKPDGRPWERIVASADEENAEMLGALTEGAGLLAPIDELRHAVRTRDAGRIKAVLRGLRTKEAVATLDGEYRLKFHMPLRQAVFGAMGQEAAEGDGMSDAPVRGREAAQVAEYLGAPSEHELGGPAEVKWIAEGGAREVAVTEDNSGFTGWAREVGDDPETQVLLHESRAELRALQQAWWLNADDPRKQAVILAKMKQVRATLSGDASAYEAENAEMRAQLRSAVSLGVQVALALALPGIGTGLAGFIATTAANIGATVASNAIIFGEAYSLSQLYDDVVGGGLGALGGKLGDDIARLVSKQVAGAAAVEAIRVAEAAGKSSQLVREAGAAAAMASEASLRMRALAEAANIGGSTLLSSAGTGQDGFTGEGLVQNLLMNRLGMLRPGAHGATAPEGHLPAEGPHAPVAEPHAPPSAEPHAPPSAEPHAPPAAGGHPEGHAPPAAGGHPEGHAPPAGAPKPAEVAPGAKPEAEGHKAPEAEGHKAPEAPASADGDGPARPVRPASPAERADIRAAWAALEQLASRWPSLGPAGKCAGLTDVANQMLALRGAPSVRVVAEAPGPGNIGEFNYHEWTIRIDPSQIAPTSMPPDLVARMSDLARHENEHVLQWWAMARLSAARGRTPEQISAEMHVIPDDVAKHAYETVKREGMSPVEQAAAQVWWDSIYNPASGREGMLHGRREVQKRMREIDARITEAEARHEAPDPRDLAELQRLKQEAAGFESLYEGLSEEVDAHEQGGIARMEARLAQLDHVAGMADDAVLLMRRDMEQIADEHWEQSEAGDKGDKALMTELEAEYREAAEQLRVLQARAEAAHAAHDRLAQEAAQGQTPPRAPAPAPGPGPQGGGGAPTMPPAGTGPKPRAPRVPDGFDGKTSDLGALLRWPDGRSGGTPVAALDLAQLRARGITEKWAREEAANYREHDAHNPLDPATGRGNPTAARRAAWLEQLADRLAAEPGAGGPPSAPGAGGKPPRELTDDEKWAQHEAASKAQEGHAEAPVTDAAHEIAHGHAWHDHRHEFPEARTKEQFAEIVSRAMDSPLRKTDGKRTAYWDRDTGTIVIVDPDGPHGGTAMRPSDGIGYFDRWPHVGPKPR